MRMPLWYYRAACQGMDTELFFPTADEPPTEALAVCADCPVRDRCLDYAVEHNLTDGVWGGRSAYQRKQARKAARAA